MLKYHNLNKFKNRKVLGLKFHKKIQWVPHSSYPEPDLQAFRGGGGFQLLHYKGVVDSDRVSSVPKASGHIQDFLMRRL